MTSHYEVLGVRPGATAAEIKRAYYRRARDYHPDAHAGSTSPILAEAARAMSELNQAWTVLGDSAQRHEYDRHLAGAAGGPNRRRPAPRRDKPRQLTPAAGFRYWMSSSGSRLADATGTTRIHLSVDGAVDFSPLRDLAPNGLWGLHAEGSAIDDAAMKHLSGMRGLQLLDVSATAVGDAGLVHLQGLDSLERLSLWDTEITDAGARLVGRIGSLCYLGLGRTRITDAGLVHLRSLRHLRVLQLWGTEVVGPGLEHLHGLTGLDMVTLPRKVRGRDRRRLRSALPGARID